MKHISNYSLLIVAVLFLSIQTKAQEMYPDRTGKTSYYGIEGSYGLGLLGLSSGYTNDQTYTNGNLSGKSKPYTLGKGPGAGIYCGYMFTKNAGVELGVSGLFGAGWTSTQNYYMNGATVPNSETEKASMLRFCPAIRFQTGDKKIHLYTRTGLIIGLPMAFETESVTHDYLGNESRATTSCKGNLSWGFSGSLGMLCELSSRFSVLGEVTGIIQNWSPAHLTVLKSSHNGVDDLSSLSVSNKETDYVSNPQPSTDPNQPSQAKKIYIPFNSLNISLGLHVKFGKNFKNDKARYNLGK
ncbi:MAG TPA: hypothetical protein VGO45_09105 [Bacteroidia bacterium]|jgi:hypothetical protein|nr:hypothetical protein [Bacteroidia bacterium]